MIPYARHHLEMADVAEVLNALLAARDGGGLTQGPEVEAFERDLTPVVGGEVVACSSGTAALHLALAALGVGAGDEVIVPALTFVATAAAVAYVGARPVLCDVEPSTGLTTPAHVAARVTRRTAAVIAVDYAGQPCDHEGIRATLVDLVPGRHVHLVADAAHALGATSRTTHPSLDAACYSFHPAKHVTCGEGGAVSLAPRAAERARALRTHARTPDGAWLDDTVGHNYRLPELSAALGRSQLRWLPRQLERRQRLAAAYDAALAGIDGVRPLPRGGRHALHLYVVEVAGGRDRLRAALAVRGIGTQVHYRSLTEHPVFGAGQPSCPGAEQLAATCLSLPLHPGVSVEDVRAIARAVEEETSR